MANLKEVRNRIKSVKSTQQITKAMKMVAAAKLRRAQTAIQQVRPYANKLNQMLSNIVSNLDGDFEVSYAKEREVNGALLVIVTSDRGLCGAFNTNVLKAARGIVQDKFAKVYDAGNLTVICLGKKGLDYSKRHFGKATIIDDYVNIFKNLNSTETYKVADFILNGFDAGKYDAVEVAYGQFKNPAVQYCIAETYLPVAKIEAEEVEAKFKADFIFEPGKAELLTTLVPSILRTQLHRYVLDTNASEHGARMTAMDKATENAGELLKELKLSYNKARQEAITNEILEIVGGAAALEGGS